MNERTENLAVVTLERGKVHALNEGMVRALRTEFEAAQGNDSVDAVVLTGRGSFFSFGWDVPELFEHGRSEFAHFVTDFAELYTYIYSFPKPVIASLNGHTVAGGCMLALACDRRIMAEGEAKIGLNEVTFGASVPAGSVEMLEACVGKHNAERVLLTGRLFGAAEALEIGLVDRVVPQLELQSAAFATAHELVADGAAFRSLKTMLRGPVVERMRRREAASIREFVEIWYSEPTRKRLREIRIRD